VLVCHAYCSNVREHGKPSYPLPFVTMCFSSLGSYSSLCNYPSVFVEPVIPHCMSGDAKRYMNETMESIVHKYTNAHKFQLENLCCSGFSTGVVPVSHLGPPIRD
jgi:hypothetical protein